MKTLITQPLTVARKVSWKLLPALLVALCSLCSVSVNAQSWTIGTGTSMYSSTSTIPPSPLGYYSPTARAQYIYTAAELTAAGMTAGPIHQIGFNVGALNGAIAAPNYTVSMGLYTGTSLPTTGYQAVSQVYNNGTAGYAPIVGWNYIPLTPTFNWNGTSAIIIDVCHAKLNTTYGPAGAGVYYNTMTGASLSAAVSSATSYCGQSYAIIGGSGSTIRPNVRFNRLAPCTGAPTAGTLSPVGVVSTLCPGSQVTLGSTGYTNALNTNFQWMTSTNGTTWTPVPGATGPTYTTPPMISTVYYHLKITCLNTGQSDSTANVQFTFPGGFPVYATLPYYEGFETWGNGCSTGDKVSSNNWTNSPSTGNQSWRRDDDGTSAGWTNPASPSAGGFKEGAHSARYHAYYAAASTPGFLSLYANMSGATGNKDLTFWWKSDNYASAGDSLTVDTSSDGGLTFGRLVSFGPPPTVNWTKQYCNNLPLNSATTVFRFTAKNTLYGNSYNSDIFIDGVTILPPCTGKPAAGRVDSAIACSGKPFTLSTTGTSATAGLSWQWQYKAVGATFWAALPGGTVPMPSHTITTPTMYRVIVTCTNSSLSDTSAAYTVPIAPFYYCYCPADQNASYSSYGYVLVGNAAIRKQPSGALIMYNGNPLPTTGNTATSIAGYEDFRTKVTPPTLVRDSSYELALTQTSLYSSFLTGMYAAAWLDLDMNGNFDTYERFMFKTIPSQTNPTAKQTFTIPSTSPVGLTGLRVTIQYYYNVYGINPCGLTYAYGQYEDYLARIEYQPCSGPVNPGIAIVSDTSVCPGYTIDLVDTTYAKTNTNIIRYWQVSTNGGASYSVIPGSGQTDILYNVVVTASSKYRLMTICGPTGDTTYSNAVSVTSPSPVHCYPVSTSALGAVDSSDIGAFIIGNFFNPAPGIPAGPHLSNPAARKRHSDFTNLTPIELYADSTYRVAVFQTMPGAYHSDALVSVFIDYNNNLNYDVTAPPPPTPFTSELVFQGKTRVDSFFLDTKFTVPDAVIPNVLTGMRVILNNDVNMVPSNPALKGNGLFTSGEVEDYIVIFRRAGLSAGTTNLLQNLSLYPNPTGGKVTVLSDAARSVNHMDVVVTTITGQQIMSRSFDNVGAHFTTTLDLSNQSKGIYFVELHADGEKITRKLVLQ